MKKEAETILLQDLLNRDNWNIEKINAFLNFKMPVKITPSFYTSINFSPNKIKKIESSQLFKNFISLEDYLLKLSEVEKKIINNTKKSILKFENNIPTVDNSLLKNLNKFTTDKKLNNEILFFHNKEIDSNKKYELFTDGSLKKEGNLSILGCSGWIRDEDNNVVLEFCNKIDISNIDEFDFEIIALKTGLEMCLSLGIKNLDVFSDSSSEMKILEKLKSGFLSSRVIKEPELYKDIESFFPYMNINFHYIPRDYNNHADLLSKIFQDEYISELNIKLQKSLEIGFVYNDTNQLYSNKKINILENITQDNVTYFIIRNKKLFKFNLNLKDNLINHCEIFNTSELQNIPKYFPINNQDAFLINYMINYFKDNPNECFNMIIPSKGFEVRINKTVPINSSYLNIFIELDKVINEKECINFMPLNKEIFKLANDFILKHSEEQQLKNSQQKIKI